jgi:hypothetical protein
MAKTIAFAPFVLIALAMHWPFAFLAGLFVPFIILKGYRIGWRLHGDGATAVPTAFGEYFAGLAIALLLLGMD